MSDQTLQPSRRLSGKLVESYEPVNAPRHSATSPALSGTVAEDVRDVSIASDRNTSAAASRSERLTVNRRERTKGSRVASARKSKFAPDDSSAIPSNWLLKRGHTLTFCLLFLFTVVLYFRPYELIPSLAAFSSIAFWIALATLAVFIPAQLGLEGNLTARPREVNLVLLLTLTALLSIPLATDRNVAWEEFTGSFIKVIIMFIVMVNVVRTEWRLKSLIWLSFAVSCFLSYHAIKDYSSGIIETTGDRVWGAIGGAFGNPNDLALHLATMIPLAFALFFSTRNALAKPIYLGCILLMTAGIVVTFSRGGFLGLTAAAMVFGWKAGRNNRFLVIAGGTLLLVAFLAFAPGGYMGRLASIYDHNLDTGSAHARGALFWRSLYVTAANPVFGVGMSNFPIVGIRNQVSHNAYTQVSAEMGLAALAFYCLFIVTPFKRLLRIERTTERTPPTRHLHYLAIGLQASIVAYAVSSFFGSVAYIWYIYYLVGYALCLDRLHSAQIAHAQPASPYEETTGMSSRETALSRRQHRK